MKAFLTGLGIGVGLGILFAPENGKVTRGRVRERIYDFSKRFSRQVDSAQEAISSSADVLSGRPSEAFDHENEPEFVTRKKPKSTEYSSETDWINSINRDELMTVNGIGPVLADRIIASRPYSSTRELVERGIVAPSTLQELERQFGGRRKESA